MELVAVVFLGYAVVAAGLAHRIGLSAVFWFVIGLLMGPIALWLVCCAPPLRGRRYCSPQVAVLTFLVCTGIGALIGWEVFSGSMLNSEAVGSDFDKAEVIGPIVSLATKGVAALTNVGTGLLGIGAGALVGTMIGPFLALLLGRLLRPGVAGPLVER